MSRTSWTVREVVDDVGYRSVTDEVYPVTVVVVVGSFRPVLGTVSLLLPSYSFTGSYGIHDTTWCYNIDYQKGKGYTG